MKSFKIRLELNNNQRTLAKKHAGVARFAYNWGLNKCKTAFANKEKRPSAIDLHKSWVAEIKSEKAWTYEVSKCSPQQAFRNLNEGYNRVFKVKGAKFPVFKKKGVGDSFYLEGAIYTRENKIKLPRFGWVSCSESLPTAAELKNVTISRHADHWFVSLKTSSIPSKVENIDQKPVVGVDLGIKTLATLSDGKVFEAIKPYKKHKRKLKILQRRLSKKFIKDKPASKNYKKAQQKVAKLHQRIANVRKDYTHKLTSYLAKNHSEIVVETLNVKGMSKNHRLASAILDGGFFEFTRQLEYKSGWYGSKLTKVSTFYPSSKTCSRCKAKKQTLKLSERIFHCEHCGCSIDRDLNASLNLKSMAVSSTVTACGEVNQVEHYAQLSL